MSPLVGGKSKHKTKVKCDSCLRYEDNPLWGHQQCSAHRDCAQGNQWEPLICADCKRQKSDLNSKLIQKERDIFFHSMYTMFHNTARYKLRVGHSEWLYDQGIELLFVRTGVEVPPVSSFIISPSSNVNMNKQTHGGSSSRSQNSVLSILADANTREKLDKDISATISNKIDDNFNSVEDYLDGNFSVSDNSPMPEFRIQKKRADDQQNKQPLKRHMHEGNTTVNQEFTGSTPHSEHSYQGRNSSTHQHYDNDRNSGTNELEIAPTAEDNNEDVDDYEDDDYDEDYDDYDHNNPQSYADYDYNNYDQRSYVDPQNNPYGNDYSNHNYRDNQQSLHPEYAQRDPRQFNPRHGYNFQQFPPYPIYYPPNSGYTNSYPPSGGYTGNFSCNSDHSSRRNFQDPYAAQIAINHARNNQALTPRQPTQRELGFDPSTGQYWVTFNPSKHVKKENNKMEITEGSGSYTCTVRYRVGHPDQFQTTSVTSNNKIGPIMDGRAAHTTLMEAFGRPLSQNEFNSNICAMESYISPGQMLAKAVDLFKEHLERIMSAAVNNKEKDLLDAFPKLAFTAPTIMDFTLGWPLSNSTSFAKFAKDVNLDPKEFSAQLKVPSLEFKIHESLLKNEKIQRHCLIQCLTQVHYLDLYGEKIDGVEDVLKTRNDISSLHMKAMAKPSLYLLKHHMKRWLIAKIRIRKAILTDRSKPAANDLLLSNPFENKIFPDKDINELMVDSPQKNILPALGLSMRSKFAKDNPERATSQQEPPWKKQKTQRNSGYTNHQSNETLPFLKPKDSWKKPSNRGQGFRPGRGRGSFRGRGRYVKPREFNNTGSRDKSYNKDKSQNPEK